MKWNEVKKEGRIKLVVKQGRKARQRKLGRETMKAKGGNKGMCGRKEGEEGRAKKR